MLRWFRNLSFAARSESKDREIAGGDANHAAVSQVPVSTDATALHERSLELLTLGRHEEALACADAALHAAPGLQQAWNHRGNVLYALGRFEESIDCYDRALHLQENYWQAWYNKGLALLDMERAEDALASFDRALRIDSGNAPALADRGLALRMLGRHKEAADSFEAAIRIDAGYAVAHFNIGVQYLMLGELERGWAEYEWRWQCDRFDSKEVDIKHRPRWTGNESVAGKTVLLVSEQGLGDVLQFCRYARMLSRRGARVILQTFPPLVSLLANLDGVDMVYGTDEVLPDFDYHCPLLSLPLAFGTRLDSIPAETPYLHADPDRLALWGKRLGPRTRPRIGLAWSGKIGHENDRHRSIPLADMVRIVSPHAEFFSLHKEIRPADRAVLEQRGDIRFLGDDIDNFADTAAIVELMDLVISVDTSVAHLAGAMGKPLWILLPYQNPDWRWLLERSDSPWYPSARLFRQPASRDWASVLSAISMELPGQTAAPAKPEPERTATAAKLPEQAYALHKSGRAQEAYRLLADAVRHFPADAELPHALGNICVAEKRYQEALEHYRRALSIRPGDVPTLRHMGIALRAMGHHEEALASLDSAIANAPDDVETLNNRGITLKGMKRFDEALATFDRALQIRPDHLDALNNRGNTLQDLKRLDEALDCYDAVLQRAPDHVDAWYNRGVVFLALDRHQDAIACFDKAIALNPACMGAWHNRGVALNTIKRHTEALEQFAQALRLDPGNAETLYADGLCRLLLGDFDAGWKRCESRWETAQCKAYRRNLTQPLWLGEESLNGKTILLHAEQGLGDTIQFARYARLVADLGATVLLQVQPAVVPLLAELDGVDMVYGTDEVLPDFDCHCPLLSLPLAFGTRLDSIPAAIPYVHPDPDSLALWRKRLGPRTRPRIGLAWSGNPGHLNDRHRSIPLADMVRIVSPHAEFFSLHKEVRPADRAVLEQRGDIRFLGDDIDNFADTAAIVELMDLVISVDTSVAHLAGAMGKPLWILLPYQNSDWRWMLDRADSPWYPSARLFRQQCLRSWTDLLICVTNEVEQFICSAD